MFIGEPGVREAGDFSPTSFVPCTSNSFTPERALGSFTTIFQLPGWGAPRKPRTSVTASSTFSSRCLPRIRRAS